MIFTSGERMFKGSRFHSTQSYIIPVNHDDVIFMSYDTPVMMKCKGVWYERDEFYSVTTSRQKNRFKRDYNIGLVEVVSNDSFKRLLMAVLG